MRCGRLKYGEAAVVGGADLFGCSPPAENLLVVRKCQVSSVATFICLRRVRDIYVMSAHLDALM